MSRQSTKRLDVFARWPIEFPSDYAKRKRDWRLAHPEVIARYVAKNKDKIRANQRRWLDKEKDRRKKLFMIGYWRNREKYLAKMKAYRERNKEILNRKQREYRAANREVYNKRVRFVRSMKKTIERPLTYCEIG